MVSWSKELKVVQRADPTFDDDLQDWLRRAHCWLAKPKGTKNFYKSIGFKRKVVPTFFLVFSLV